MLTFGITIPNFIVIFGIRISFVLRQSELTRDFHPLDNAHAERTSGKAAVPKLGIAALTYENSCEGDENPL